MIAPSVHSYRFNLKKLSHQQFRYQLSLTITIVVLYIPYLIGMPYVDLYSSVYIFVTKIFIFLHVAKTLLYCIVKFFITCLKNVDIRVQISDIKYMFILCSTIVNVRVLLSLLSLRHQGRLNDINTLYCVVFMPCSSRLRIFISGAFM